MLGTLWHTILFQPILNLLVATYNLTGGSLGLAIIVVTVLLKIALYPFSQKAIHSQRALQQLQPKIDALKLRLKDDKEGLAKELMLLYKTERVSPLSSCLPLLVQLPFLIALYQVFRTGIGAASIEGLYSFVANPGHLDTTLFGLVNLAHASWPLALITGAAQFWQTKMLVISKPPLKVPGSQDESLAAAMNKQALYVMPAMTVVFGFSLPGGLILYWLTNTLLTVGQQYVAFRRAPAQPS